MRTRNAKSPKSSAKAYNFKEDDRKKSLLTGFTFHCPPARWSTLKWRPIYHVLTRSTLNVYRTSKWDNCYVDWTERRKKCIRRINLHSVSRPSMRCMYVRVCCIHFQARQSKPPLVFTHTFPCLAWFVTYTRTCTARVSLPVWGRNMELKM